MKHPMRKAANQRPFNHKCGFNIPSIILYKQWNRRPTCFGL